MRISHFKQRYHYFNAIDDDERQVGGVAVEHDEYMHHAYKEHCKAGELKCAKIIYVTVDKSHRCQGIASALLKKTLDYYKDWDVFLNVVPLDTKQERHNSVQSLTKFYEKFGFKRCETPGNLPAMVRPAQL